MIEKNQEFEVVIEGYGSDGQGVARYNGVVVFVPFALLGEKVKVHVIKVAKTFVVAKLIEIIVPSKQRIENVCPLYKKCGGCSLQHAKYEHALEIKKDIVKQAFQMIGGFKDVEIDNVVGSDLFLEYRNKAAFPLVVVDDVLELCMYRSLSHDPIFIDDCKITSRLINKIAKIFKEFVNKENKADLRNYKHLVIREIEEKVLITIVSEKKPNNILKFVETIKEKINLKDDGFGIFWCKKISDNNVILDGEVVNIYGINAINVNILGVNVEISPKSFFQINLSTMIKMYHLVVSLVDDEVVVDAYSGAGLMSALVAQKAKCVYGIEIIKDATKNADMLKENNRISNLCNINGDVNKELPKLIEKIGKGFSLILDPPRKGVDYSVIETILSCMPETIIYVSCNPASLARDLKFLVAGGYQISKTVPFDMFPQTAHVETVVVLKKRKR